MKIIVLGVQASGKGTQADLISDELGIPHISTGDILRKNMRESTELGRLAQQYINRGNLVPDEVITQVVKKRLEEPDCREGYVLDGFPRTIAQGEALDGFASTDVAFEIEVSDGEAIKRITGRRTCGKCGRVTSVHSKDYSGRCSSCGGRLVVRDDDTEQAVRQRLEIYHRDTEPLLEFYEQKGILVRINGERPIEEINKEIIKKIKG